MTDRLVVVGLGPAGPELVTAAAGDAVARADRRYLRTARCPAAGVTSWTATFDDIYDSATDLEHVYREIVERLVVAAAEHGDVVYAVPGSPLVGERSVALLLADERVDVAIVPGLSFVDLVWTRLGIDPVAVGARVVDGHRFAAEAAGDRGPFLVAQCDSLQVLSDVKLAFEDATPDGAVVLQRLGLPDERVTEVAWSELDRAIVPDHLTSVWIPNVPAPVGAELVRFAELVRTLRARCPWDREQTHASLTRHLLEETYEVLEAIEGLDGEGFAHLEEELGDLLFQVVFHATLAAEEGQFTLADVARGIHDKLVHRHPHVFGEVEAATAGEVMANWEQIKKAEKGRESVMDGIPGDLPSLLYAHKIQRKAAAAGIEADPVELPEGAGDAEVGRLLFAVVAAARRRGVDPEAALRGAAARFRDEVRRRESGNK